MRGPGICILKAVHPSGETSGLATAAKGEKGKLPAAEMVTISWKWREVAGSGGRGGVRLSSPGKILPREG